MAMDANGLRNLSFVQIFPWLRLFRVFGLSLDAKKIVLGTLGVVLIWLGWGLLDRVFPGSVEITPPLAPEMPIVHRLVGIEPLAHAAELVTEPIRTPAMPFRALFALNQGTARFFHALLAALWALVVWGVIGCAIARIAVVQITFGERVGLVDALAFSIRKLVPLVGAPLTTLAGVALFAALCALMGLLYQVPGTWGAIVAGVLAYLPLLAGLLMALILTGIVAGWPLMVTTVATEGEDGFDALSRTYSYVFQRPGVYAFYVVLSWVLGIVGLVVVSTFARAVLHLAVWGLAFGAPDMQLAMYLNGTEAPMSAAAAIHAWWFSLVPLLAFGWIHGYVWSAAGVVYLLLRHDVDGTAWDDVFRPQTPGELPLPEAVEAPEPPAPTQATPTAESESESAPLT